MGQSVFLWSIVNDDGESQVVKATPDDLLKKLGGEISFDNTVAVVRLNLE